MTADHEQAAEHMTMATDALRAQLASSHPLLDQLIALGMQLLIAWISGFMKPPTPTHIADETK